LATHTEAYFTWSQGFRRGGANSFVIEGPVEEPTSLLTYKPDTTDNYEIGLKGTWRGLYYSGDVFYIDWSNPQIDLLTPYNLTSVVVNAKAATSKGFEVELSGPIPYGPHGLSFSLGLAYAQARLSQDFGLPAGSGVGTIIQDAIVGKSGDRLPGAPDFSGSLNASYQLDLEPGPLTFSLGADYRSSIINVLPSINPNTPATTTPGYAIMHGSITFEHKDWEFELFSTNLTDSHIVLSTSLRTLASYDTVGSWGNSYAIARPREVGIKLTKRF
jgi:outer membrane receptor protein involved in Fe transport